jgi:hypothetical protein
MQFIMVSFIVLLHAIKKLWAGSSHPATFCPFFLHLFHKMQPKLSDRSRHAVIKIANAAHSPAVQRKRPATSSCQPSKFSNEGSSPSPPGERRVEMLLIFKGPEKWVFSHPNPHVQLNINNRYIGNFMGKRQERGKRLQGPIRDGL